MTTSTSKTAHKSSKNQAAPSTEPTQSNPAPTTAPVIYQKSPPADAHIPAPPTGFTPSNLSTFVGFVPRLLELGALPGAIEDLRSFADYPSVLGDTAPPLAEAIAAFELADEWSTMRKASQIWDEYAQMQEGIAWATLRPIMDRLRPAFMLAVGHNPSLRSKFANLTTLLNVKQSIAKKGVATKALNKQAVAEGKPPIHGKAGKRRKKVADRAIVAAAEAATPRPVTAPASTPPAPSTAPAAPAEAPAAPAASNGASHS